MLEDGQQENMKNVIIAGGTGMVGGLVLEECLNDSGVAKVTSIVRKPTGIRHNKLEEVIHEDFLDFSPIADRFKNQDICFYCVGVYTGTVPKDTFREITVDYTRAFAETLRLHNDQTTFCFLSGQGADLKQQSRIMFARDKGAAENLIIQLNFDQTYLFRPGYIYPVTLRKEPNLGYKLMRMLYKPILSKLYPNIGVPSLQLAQVMVNVALNGADKVIFENRDIKEYSN
ncbi:MAG: NAD(P)H-binding protein [Proteobacteria bacterium]|nr:NAD(P)H-binding protein [Pseudomonadota bacterium]